MNLSAPYWQDYRDLWHLLSPDAAPAGTLPDTSTLNELLAAGIQQASGKAIRFVAADQLPGVAYEQHIFQTGEISTRQNSWHDLFNALVWSRFPRIKAAMNGMHHAEIESASRLGCGQGRDLGRGPVRDALTLFDECGVVVVSRRSEVLQALVQRDWKALFLTHRDCWQRDCAVFVLGHALLEKFLKPYKAITAQALLFHDDGSFLQQDRSRQWQDIDSGLSVQLSAGARLRSTAELSPLPVMGIPGWWTEGSQDQDFYADERVFRPPPDSLTPTTILNLEAIL